MEEEGHGINTRTGDPNKIACSPATLNHSPFLEVLCRGEGKIRRFAAGTKAGFALERINKKMTDNARAATCIEAVKDGEKPVEFGPDAELVIYGPGWTLQTLHEQGPVWRPMESTLYSDRKGQNFLKPYPTSEVRRSSPKSPVQYFAKIALAFCFLFFLAGMFTLILQNLPHFLLYLQA